MGTKRKGREGSLRNANTNQDPLRILVCFKPREGLVGFGFCMIVFIWYKNKKPRPL